MYEVYPAQRYASFPLSGQSFMEGLAFRGAVEAKGSRVLTLGFSTSTFENKTVISVGKGETDTFFNAQRDGSFLLILI